MSAENKFIWKNLNWFEKFCGALIWIPATLMVVIAVLVVLDADLAGVIAPLAFLFFVTLIFSMVGKLIIDPRVEALRHRYYQSLSNEKE